MVKETELQEKNQGITEQFQANNEWKDMSVSEIKKELENVRQEKFVEADPLDLDRFDFNDEAIKTLLRFKKDYERVKKAVQELKRREEEGWENEDKKADFYAGNLRNSFWKGTSVSVKKYYLDLILKTANGKLNDNEISALKPEEGNWREKVNSLVNEDKYSRLDVANLVAYGEDLLTLIRSKNQEVYDANVLQPK